MMPVSDGAGACVAINCENLGNTPSTGKCCETAENVCGTCKVGTTDDALKCATCKAGFESDGHDGCQPISDIVCANIADKAGACCENSENHCTKCSSQTKTECIACEVGFVVKNKACVAIECTSASTEEAKGTCCEDTTKNCATCKAGADVGTCNTCKSDSISQNNQCVKCTDGKVPNEDQTECITPQTACQAKPSSTTGGKCLQCDAQNKLCVSCVEPTKYEPNKNGGCTEKQQQQGSCVAVSNGNPGTCSTCNQDLTLCATCNDAENYVPDENGGCKIKAGKCSPYLTSYVECKEDDPNFCTKCENNYGLSAGYCTLCPEGLFYSTTEPCIADCSFIPNCKLQKKDEYNPLNPNCIIENGEFYCKLCEDGYYENEDTYKSCIKEEEVPDGPEPPFSFSEYCLECDKENEKCNKCSGNFTPLYGDCVCENGLEVNGACLLDNECDNDKVTNCTQCVGDDNYCKICESNFYRDNGKCKRCDIEHCELCSQEKGICQRCNRTEHFTESKVFWGKCVCEQGFEYKDNQCLRPAGPYIPPDTSDLESNVDLVCGNDKVCEITKESIDNAEKNTINMGDIKGGNTIKLTPEAAGNKEFKFNVATAEQVTFDVPEGTEVEISCMDGSNIIIPPANKIEFIPKGEVTISTPDSDTNDKISLSKVIPLGSDASFKSAKKLILSELQIIGDRKCTGQDLSENKPVTECELVKIEGGGRLTPKNIKFDKINIGSFFNIEENSGVDLEGAIFKVFHGRKQFGGHVPIKFHTYSDNFSSLKGSKVMINQLKNESEAIPTETEERFTVAEFPYSTDADKDKAKLQCENMEYQGGDASFPTPKCEEENGKIVLVSTKEKEDDKGKSKDKLSAGAIAGIVIACIVVVAAIIALLVYFFVIKKKNQSTTSTQGDSSIAI